MRRGVLWGLLVAAGACSHFTSAPAGPPASSDGGADAAVPTGDAGSLEAAPGPEVADAGLDGPAVLCGASICLGAACCIDPNDGGKRCTTEELECQAPLVRIECDDTGDCASLGPTFVCCADAIAEADASGRYAMTRAHCIPSSGCNPSGSMPQDILCNVNSECAVLRGVCVPTASYLPIFGEVNACVAQ